MHLGAWITRRARPTVLADHYRSRLRYQTGDLVAAVRAGVATTARRLVARLDVDGALMLLPRTRKGSDLMTPNEYLGHAIDLAFEAGKGTPNAFDLTFGQRDDTALLAAIDIACEHVWAILDKVAGEEGPRPEAFLRLYEHLDEVRATARGERWPR